MGAIRDLHAEVLDLFAVKTEEQGAGRGTADIEGEHAVHVSVAARLFGCATSVLSAFLPEPTRAAPDENTSDRERFTFTARRYPTPSAQRLGYGYRYRSGHLLRWLAGGFRRGNHGLPRHRLRYARRPEGTHTPSAQPPILPCRNDLLGRTDHDEVEVADRVACPREDFHSQREWRLFLAPSRQRGGDPPILAGAARTLRRGSDPHRRADARLSIQRAVSVTVCFRRAH